MIIALIEYIYIYLIMYIICIQQGSIASLTLLQYTLVFSRIINRYDLQDANYFQIMRGSKVRGQNYLQFLEDFLTCLPFLFGFPVLFVAAPVTGVEAKASEFPLGFPGLGASTAGILRGPQRSRPQATESRSFFSDCLGKLKENVCFIQKLL